MPIYVVRWPRSLRASVVQADDDDALRAVLAAAPDGARAAWTKLDAPLWLDLDPGFAPALDEGEAAPAADEASSSQVAAPSHVEEPDPARARFPDARLTPRTLPRTLERGEGPPSTSLAAVARAAWPRTASVLFPDAPPARAVTDDDLHGALHEDLLARFEMTGLWPDSPRLALESLDGGTLYWRGAPLVLPALQGDFLRGLVARAPLLGAPEEGEPHLARDAVLRRAADALTARQREALSDEPAKQQSWQVVQIVFRTRWQRTAERTDRWMAWFAAVREMYGLDMRQVLALAERVRDVLDGVVDKPKRRARASKRRDDGAPPGA